MELNMDNFNEKEAHQKYKELDIPYRFTLEQVDTILKQKYRAIELDKKLFPDLERSLFFNPSYVTKCYAIQDEEVLSRLFDENEKKKSLEFITSVALI